MVIAYHDTGIQGAGPHSVWCRINFTAQGMGTVTGTLRTNPRAQTGSGASQSERAWCVCSMIHPLHLTLHLTFPSLLFWNVHKRNMNKSPVKAPLSHFNDLKGECRLFQEWEKYGSFVNQKSCWHEIFSLFNTIQTQTYTEDTHTHSLFWWCVVTLLIAIKPTREKTVNIGIWLTPTIVISKADEQHQVSNQRLHFVTGQLGRSISPQLSSLSGAVWTVDIELLQDHQPGALALPLMIFDDLSWALFHPRVESFHKTQSRRFCLRNMSYLDASMPQIPKGSQQEMEGRGPTARGLGWWLEYWQSSFSESSAPSISPSSLDSRLARSAPAGGRGGSGV